MQAVLPQVAELLGRVGGQAAGRIWRRLQSSKLYHKISSWPLWAQHAQLRAAAGGHGTHVGLLNNRDRYGLYHHLAANGLDPQTVAGHVLAGDVRGVASRLATKSWEFVQHSGYQEEAERHVHRMVQDHTSGHMWNVAKRFFSHNLGRVVKSKEHEEYLRKMFLKEQVIEPEAIWGAGKAMRFSKGMPRLG